MMDQKKAITVIQIIQESDSILCHRFLAIKYTFSGNKIRLWLKSILRKHMWIRIVWTHLV